MIKYFDFLLVGLILGIAGACRTDELVNLTVDDIEDVGSSLIVKIPNTKTKIPRARRKTLHELSSPGFRNCRLYQKLELIFFFNFIIIMNSFKLAPESLLYLLVKSSALATSLSISSSLQSASNRRSSNCSFKLLICPIFWSRRGSSA
ncbi:hypothetical protein NQ317_005387 [Molorchus minor]|uniref:Tyr recombinase domain-containing protein n=1 Tax=Molorchus minor TaxID=1323400 RepID=A0ABQ9ISV5_9CUCU|nr:hypothetical protein NQ317_005387 [Molorchus minor]